MASKLCFDFQIVYDDEYKKRLSGASIYKYLDKYDIKLDDFIKNIITLENTYYISCSSFYKNPIKEVFFDVYPNYFLRPKENSKSLKEKKSFLINGDLVFNRNDNYFFFRAKDIYMCDDEKIKIFEKEFKLAISFKEKNKKGNTDSILARNIIESTPLIYDKKDIELLEKWDDYLEFEKNFFNSKIDYYKTRSYSLIELKEVKRSIENVKKYKEHLYFDDGSNYIYLFSNDNTKDIGDPQSVLEFEVIIKKNEKIYNDLNYFVNQDIELASPKEALDKEGRLITKDDNFDFSFKTCRLGSLLKPLKLVNENEHEEIYTFSKFWVSDDERLFSSARINDYIYTNFSEFPLLVNILTGEIALYNRGKQVLKDIKKGNVKNPGIIGYLLNVDFANENYNTIKKENITWSINNLDEFQKEAVYRAINSNSIFLLQGPPGTGKTQTITEMVYQLNKLNKKVLLSSQTHIAIDNVLERLPNELNILPIRLINSGRKSKASRNFLPDKLVDNFYDKIINKYENEKDNFINYGKEIEIKLNEYREIEKLVNDNLEIREKYFSFNKNVNINMSNLNKLDAEILSLTQKIKDDSSLINFIEEWSQSNFEINDYKKKNIPLSLFENISYLIKKYKINDLYKIEYPTLNDYLILFKEYMLDNNEFKEDYNKLVLENKPYLEEKKDQILLRISKYEEELKELYAKRKSLINENNNLNKHTNSLYEQNKTVFNKIDAYFNNFFKERSGDNKIPLFDKEKLVLIKENIDKEINLYEKRKHKYYSLKDIFEKSASYLKNEQENIINNDRIKYSRLLLNNNANVYGITCNANSKYLQEKNEYLKTLGLGNIDLKNIDFDVVIIDEVSKATLIELLIPIIYGKSIILVGDHRQLPPMFKYKENMFERYKFNKNEFDYYKEMVENSVFKHLFARASKNKFTLLKQYRSHEQIMDIVNLFYDGKLQLGNGAQQNEAKKHYLNYETSEGLSLFTKNIHTYWFNSHYNLDRSIAYEKKLIKGSNISTSFYNEEEIYLTKNILLALDKGYTKLLDKDPTFEVPSVGVISLYGDQVKELKKEINKIKFTAINFSSSKVSTVDEFQGKEEDIIIVNFVRNNKAMQAGEFTKKFERINVALSRAKKMLIIVGSKEFFSSLKVDIEDTDNFNKVITKRIYQEIYNTCKGKIDEPNAYFKENEV